MVLIDPVITESSLAERVDYTRAQAGDRADDITFCFSFMQIALNDAPNLDMMRTLRPDLTDAELRSLPTVLSGTIEEVAERVRRVRQLGIDYVSFTRWPGVDWDTLEQLINVVLQDS